MKVQGRVYRGIEYVIIEDLPSEQKQLLLNSPNKPEFVKILVDGKMHDQCILYKEYMEWYSKVYKAPAARAIDRNDVKVNITLGKA